VPGNHSPSRSDPKSPSTLSLGIVNPTAPSQNISHAVYKLRGAIEKSRSPISFVDLVRGRKMPLKVTCQCGANLSVPDAAAGKRVKCTKCQQAISVPAAPTKKPATTPKSPQTAAPKAPDALSNLFESAGLKKREGNFCPSCDRVLPPGTAICVGCGFNLESGSKIEGFQVEVKEFGDLRLVEAAESMKRESETEKRLLSSGMPWWMMLAIILGVLFMMTAILLKMDVNTSGQTSSIAPIAKLQRAAYGPVLAFSVGGGAALVALFSWLAIAFGAIKESWKQLVLCLIPPYAIYYMFSRMKERRLTNTVLIFWISAILAGICLGYSLPKI